MNLPNAIHALFNKVWHSLQPDDYVDNMLWCPDDNVDDDDDDDEDVQKVLFGMVLSGAAFVAICLQTRLDHRRCPHNQLCYSLL